MNSSQQMSQCSVERTIIIIKEGCILAVLNVTCHASIDRIKPCLHRQRCSVRANRIGNRAHYSDRVVVAAGCKDVQGRMPLQSFHILRVDSQDTGTLKLLILGHYSQQTALRVSSHGERLWLETVTATIRQSLCSSNPQNRSLCDSTSSMETSILKIDT